MDYSNAKANQTVSSAMHLIIYEQTISPCMDLKDSLLKLFAEYSNVDLHAMGFPNGWQDEPLWR